ncbi:Phytanoyl-CoA dioxygenase [Colletotrichum asianum]
MSYPRKRASVACKYCRHRKRRCDGERPTCGLCTEGEVECEYPDEGNERRDTDSFQREMIQRLAELEDCMQRQTEMIDAVSRNRSQDLPDVSVHSPKSPQTEQVEHGFLDVNNAQTNLFGPSPTASASPLNIGSVHFRPNDNCDQDQGYEEVPFTIPMGHEATTGSLFSYPMIRNLIGDYSEDLFFQIVSQRDLQLSTLLAQNDSLLSALSLSKDVTDNLVSQFFLQVHPEIPVLDENMVLTSYSNMIAFGPKPQASTALCLLVLFLGELVSRPQETNHGHTLDQCSNLFAAAYHILLNEWAHSFDFSLPFGLFFVSVYFCYTSRPLQAWRWINMTSSTLQVMKNQRKFKTGSEGEWHCIVRLYWACFIMECDLIAEFHLPRSGLEEVIERMPFPHFDDPQDTGALIFLSVCSARKLLNRIHSAVYATGENEATKTSTGDSQASMERLASLTSTGSTAESMSRICDELSHQLNTWFDSLPNTIKPDLSLDAPRMNPEGHNLPAMSVICSSSSG